MKDWTFIRRLFYNLNSIIPTFTKSKSVCRLYCRLHKNVPYINTYAVVMRGRLILTGLKYRSFFFSVKHSQTWLLWRTFTSQIEERLTGQRLGWTKINAATPSLCRYPAATALQIEENPPQTKDSSISLHHLSSFWKVLRSGLDETRPLLFHSATSSILVPVALWEVWKAEDTGRGFHYPPKSEYPSSQLVKWPETWELTIEFPAFCKVNLALALAWTFKYLAVLHFLLICWFFFYYFFLKVNCKRTSITKISAVYSTLTSPNHYRPNKY